MSFKEETLLDSQTFDPLLQNSRNFFDNHATSTPFRGPLFHTQNPKTPNLFYNIHTDDQTNDTSQTIINVNPNTTSDTNPDPQSPTILSQPSNSPNPSLTNSPSPSPSSIKNQSNTNSSSYSNTNMAQFDIPTFNRIIPEYRGDIDSLQMFLRRCDTYHDSLDHTGQSQFVKHLIFKMSGRAFILYESQDFTSWRMLKKHLSNAISDKKSIATLQNELLSLHQQHSQNVTEFSETIRAKLKKLSDKISELYDNNDIVQASFYTEHEKLAVRAFKEGLLPPLKFRVINCPEQSFEGIRQFALEEEPFIRERAQPNHSRDNFTRNSQRNNNYYNKSQNTYTPPQRTHQTPYNNNSNHNNYSNGHNNHSNNNQHSSRFSNQRPNQSTVKCDRCGNLGHERVNCYARIRSDNPSSSDTPTLNKSPINPFANKIAMIRQNANTTPHENEKAQQLDSSQSKNPIDIPRTVTTYCSVGKIDSTTTFFIDTGADVSIIKKSALRETTPIHPDKSAILNGIAKDENDIKTEGICEADILIDNTMIHHSFQVVHPNSLDLSHDGILGADFLYQNKAIIYFDTMTIKLPTSQSITLLNEKIVPQKEKEKEEPATKEEEKNEEMINEQEFENLKGLVNTHNDCYANSVFHAILFPLFRKYMAFASIHQKQRCYCTADIILLTIQEMMASQTTYNPQQYHDMARQCFGNKKKQEDALEFIQKLFESFHLRNSCCPANIIALNVITQLRGTATDVLACTHCSYRQTNETSFYHINLPTNGSIQKTINELFFQSLRPHECECQRNYTTYKQFIITQFPEILCIALNRTTDGINKDESETRIQHRIHIKQDIYEDAHYNLKSVINHMSSSATTGHYTAQIILKNYTSILYNDNHVTHEGVNHIQPNAVYLLFYERENPQMKVHRIRTIHARPSAYESRIKFLHDSIPTSHLTPSEEFELLHIIYEFQDIFYMEGDSLTQCPLIEHSIRLYTDTAPIHVRQYRRSKWEGEEIDRQISELLKDGIIQPSTSPYNSPVLLVKKKGTDANGKPKYRMVTDFRALNAKTIPESIPTPIISELLENIGFQNSYFTVLDMAKGYWQIGLQKDSQIMTAFSSGNNHYQYTRMVMGLKSSSITFLRCILIAMHEYIGKIVHPYVDDLCITGNTFKEHLHNIQLVFQRLRECNLQVTPDKCEFAKTSVKFLGHIISDKGIQPDMDKVHIIQNFPPLTTQKHIKSFLGMVGYYRRFIPTFSDKATPLTNLLRKNTKFHWSPACETAFQYFKDILTKPPILRIPDFNSIFLITTDASQTAISAILSQGNLGEDLPIAFISRKLHEPETRYSTSEQEILAVLFAIQQFRCYIFNQKFIVYSDNKALQWLFQIKSPSSRLMRWKIALAGYDFEIRHIKGKTNKVADCLSRYIPESVETHKICIITRSKTKQNMEAIKLYKTPKETHHLNIADKTNTPIITPTIIETEDTNIITAYPIEIILTHANGADGIKQMSPDLTSIHVGEIGVPTPITTIFIAIKDDANDLIDETIWDNTLQTLKLALEQHLIHDTHIFQRKMKCSTNEFHVFKNKLQMTFANSDFHFCLLKNTIILLTDPSEINQILYDFHDNPLSGHQGIHRMLGRIGAQYKWAGMTRDIKDYVRKCDICQTTKFSKNKIEPMRVTSTASRPWEIIHLDIVGPLPESSEGYKYILTFQDQLTKFFGAFPIMETKAEVVANTFAEKIVLQYGIPEYILSDQGANFLSHTMTQVLKLLGIKRKTTTAFHPQTNATLERQHKVLKAMLRSYANEDKSNWPAFTPYAVFVINTTINSSTNYQPYALLYGHPLHLPTNLTKSLTPVYTYDDYYTQLRFKIQKAHQIARDQIMQIKENNKEQYDYNHNVIQTEYNVGDEVLILDNERPTKMHNPYKGPFTITEIISDTNVRVKTGRHNKIIHKNLLKKYYT